MVVVEVKTKHRKKIYRMQNVFSALAWKIGTVLRMDWSERVEIDGKKPIIFCRRTDAKKWAPHLWH